MLPETDQKGGIIISEKIKEKLKTSLTIGNRKIHVTLTFGVGSVSLNADVKEYLDRIDMASYQGKDLGRNCVVAINELE